MVGIGITTAVAATALAQSKQETIHLPQAYLASKNQYSCPVKPNTPNANTKPDTLYYEFWTVMWADTAKQDSAAKPKDYFLVQPYPTSFNMGDILNITYQSSQGGVTIDQFVHAATQAGSPYANAKVTPRIPNISIHGAQGIITSIKK